GSTSRLNPATETNRNRLAAIGGRITRTEDHVKWSAVRSDCRCVVPRCINRSGRDQLELQGLRPRSSVAQDAHVLTEGDLSGAAARTTLTARLDTHAGP